MTVRIFGVFPLNLDLLYLRLFPEEEVELMLQELALIIFILNHPKKLMILLPQERDLMHQFLILLYLLLLAPANQFLRHLVLYLQ